MALKQPSLAEEAINRALNRLKAPESRAHRDTKKLLEALNTSRMNLVKAFDNRIGEREDQATKSARASLAAAETYLKTAEGKLKETARLNDANLTRFAENSVEFANRQIDLVKKTAAFQASVVASANAFDQKLLDWMDELMLLAVNALDSDRNADLAVAIASGGLIVGGGIAAGPFAAVAIAAASAGLLLVDMRDKLLRSKLGTKADQEAERVEFAQTLISFVTRLANDWLTIICPHGSSR